MGNKAKSKQTQIPCVKKTYSVFNMDFSEIVSKQWILKQLNNIGLKKPTPIQENCIPPILKGQDCVGCARTGSGKTLAFALPILHTLSNDPYGIYALVLTPTRELAFQIADQFRAMGKPIGLRDVVVVGGRDMMLQGRDLASRPHVVIATPGRLADQLQSCVTFSLKKIKYLVLDEADRLLEGGFDDQLRVIFDNLPQKKQTLLFSATMSDLEQYKSKINMNDDSPYQWQESQNDNDFVKTAENLKQCYVLTPFGARDAYLVNIIQKFNEKEPNGSIMVFTKTCKSAQLLSMTLNNLGFSSQALHSMRSQKERMAALADFRSCQVKILVATDVASRGLDIPEVQLVINHNVPSVTKDYIHRVGRTARAGKGGQAVTLVTPSDVVLVQAIEEMIKTKMTEYEEVKDDEVADIHVQVGVTKREQDIKLNEMDYDEKKNIHKRKKLIMKGLDPDEVEKEKKKAWKRKKRMQSKKRKSTLKKDLK